MNTQTVYENTMYFMGSREFRHVNHLFRGVSKNKKDCFLFFILISFILINSILPKLFSLDTI